MLVIQILERKILFPEAAMKKLLISFSILFLLLFLLIPTNSKAATVLIDDLTLTGDCAGEASPEDFFWEIGFNDEIISRDDVETISNESFYKLEAPCKVFFGDTFEVRITATDDVCNGSSFGATIADRWYLTDTLLSGPPVVTTVASGSFWSNDINVYPSGVWQKSYMRPTPTPDNHDFAFGATDLGHCGGGHNWTGSVSEGTVVDPLRESAVNSPPAITANGDGAIYNIFDRLVLSGTASDNEGEALRYLWLIDGSAVDSGSVGTNEGGAPVRLPLSIIGNGLSLGVHTITLQASDSENTVSTTIEIEYVDSTSPTLAPTSDTTELWPPNNDMLPVTITANASDNSGESVFISVEVASSSASGDYAIENIDQDTGVIDLLLKASSGAYTVTIWAEDSAENTASASVVINVAENRSGSGKGLKKGHGK